MIIRKGMPALMAHTSGALRLGGFAGSTNVTRAWGDFSMGRAWRTSPRSCTPPAVIVVSQASAAAARPVVTALPVAFNSGVGRVAHQGAPGLSGD